MLPSQQHRGRGTQEVEGQLVNAASNGMAGWRSADWLMNLMAGGFQALGSARVLALTTTDIRTRLEGLLSSGAVGLSALLLLFFQVTRDKQTTSTPPQRKLIKFTAG